MISRKIRSEEKFKMAVNLENLLSHSNLLQIFNYFRRYLIYKAQCLCVCPLKECTPSKDSHENLQGGPGSGFRPKKFLTRPHPGVQGQKRVPRVLLQPQPCILEKSLLNKSCRAPPKPRGGSHKNCTLSNR